MSELELLGLESSEGGTVTVSPGDFFFFFFKDEVAFPVSCSWPDSREGNEKSKPGIFLSGFHNSLELLQHIGDAALCWWNPR